MKFLINVFKLFVIAQIIAVVFGTAFLATVTYKAYQEIKNEEVNYYDYR